MAADLERDFTSTHLPPGVPSRRRFAEICRGYSRRDRRGELVMVAGINGAYPVGKQWVCPAAAWRAHFAIQATAAAQPSVAQMAASYGQLAGFRPSRVA